MISFYTDKIIIDIYVQPGAKNTLAVGTYNSYPKIKIAKEPTDGKANQEVLKFFANILKIKQNKIEIIAGEKSRVKKLAIFDISQNTKDTLQGLYTCYQI